MSAAGPVEASRAYCRRPRATGEDPIETIEGRWTLQILLCLASGEHRFADLRSVIPRVSANILTDRLRALECTGLVERSYLPPPHASHVYTLTTLAADLKPALDALARWRATQRKEKIR
jgi:DNA-binding HxlR family transcriptional regulator